MNVALVVKKTSFRKFALEKRDPFIKGLLRRGDPTVTRMHAAHNAHEATLREVEQALKRLGTRVLSRGGPRRKLAANVDLVISVGGDGTLLTASHQVGPTTPLIGINSAPTHSVGFFCTGQSGSVFDTLARAIAGKLTKSTLTRMRVDINDRTLHNRVLNDALFCHASPAATSRYVLRICKADARTLEEEQRSSGVWVGPSAGSTAAQRSAGGRVLALTSKRLQFVVREPYHPDGQPLHMTRGLIDANESLTIACKVRDGRVFLDGHRIVHPVTLGDALTMRRSDESLIVLGLAEKARA